MNLIVTKDNLNIFWKVDANDIDIVIPDLISFNDQDFTMYEVGLQNLADYIIQSYNHNQIIRINVLTDIFCSKFKKIDDFYIFCKHCPCWHCNPVPSFFKLTTGDSFIPPDQLCKKSFIELKTSKYILDQLRPGTIFPEVNYDDFKEFIDLKFGNDLRRNNERSIVKNKLQEKTGDSL